MSLLPLLQVLPLDPELGCSAKFGPCDDRGIIWLLRVQIALLRVGTLLHITNHTTCLNPDNLQTPLLIPNWMVGEKTGRIHRSLMPLLGKLLSGHTLFLMGHCHCFRAGETR